MERTQIPNNILTISDRLNSAGILRYHLSLKKFTVRVSELKKIVRFIFFFFNLQSWGLFYLLS